MSGGALGYSYFETEHSIEGRWEDPVLNELFHDMFADGLVKSLDLYLSGDISEKTYRERLNDFKKKWFKKTTEKDVTKAYIDKQLDCLREKLYVECGVNEDDD